MYKLQYAPASVKYLKKLRNKELKSRLKAAIYEIAENPYIGEAKIGDLEGIFGYDVYYDNTNYEIAYTIRNREVIVTIIMVGTREIFYSELKRYIKRVK